MRSSNLKIQPPEVAATPGAHGERHEVDARWQGPGGDVLVEVKRTHNARDVRDTLLALAYLLVHEPKTVTAVCVLTQSRLSRQRVQEEIELFRQVVRRDLAPRVHLLALAPDGQVFGSPREIAPDFLERLKALVARETSPGAVTRASRQTVVSTLVMQWLRREGPQTVKALQEACGASYPTVAAAVKSLGARGLLETRSDRRVSLRFLPLEAWVQFAQAHASARQVLRYVDPTGQARPPEALARRLFKLQQQGVARDVAVGGVLGAAFHFPDLDITASPRLDLSAYGPVPADLARRLDAALEPTTDPRAKPVLVVHATHEPARFVVRRDGSWASELECFADLLEIGLTREAADMAAEFNRRRAAPKEAPAS